MNAEWEQFLRDAGARIVDSEAQDFGDVDGERAASLSKAVLIDLSDIAIIRACGADALAFLNSQLTNDLGSLGADHHMLAAYCEPKGRVITLFRIWRDGEDLLLMMPAGLVQPVVERLRRYVLRAKVSLTTDESLIAFGFVGPETRAALGATSTVGPDQIFRSNRFTALAVPGITERFLLVAVYSARQELWEHLHRKASCAGTRIWRWHDIQAGLPTVLTATSEAFVPQMLNLDQLGGISFAKGCYPGQEIVARMHYLGKLKQRLYRLSVSTDKAPPPGTKIYAPDHGEQAVGTVVTAVSVEAGRVDLLAVVQIASAADDSIVLGRPDGPRLKVESLPANCAVAAG